MVAFRDAVAKDNFEIVFVSFDKDKEAMDGYMKETKMGWLAIPYDAAQRKAVAKEFGVNSIPTLIILDKDGKKITDKGRGDVTTKGNEALKEWKKAKVETTENAEK